jgi:hypothetical protein
VSPGKQWMVTDMLIRRAKTSEIRYLCDQYAAQNSWLPCDSKSAARRVTEHLLGDTSARLWVAEKEGVIVGFLFAHSMHHFHYPFSVYQQAYCCTWCKGASAARAVKLLHEALYEEGVRQKYPIVVSSGSHLDEGFAFTRMLERFGWERRGYLAARKTPQFDRLASAVQRLGLGHG